jgi:hypothetical protein
MVGDDADARRGRWMDGQLRSISAQARRVAGEEIAYADLLEALYGMPIAPTPEADLREARDRLDAALPGDGNLGERLAAHKESLRVPPGLVLTAMQGSAARFRAATARDFELPDAEAIDWDEAHDQPWGAEARFRGNGRTHIQVNIDLPLQIPGIAYLAWHEAYPGHHAEHVIKEQMLVNRGVGEATMRTMNTPEAMLAEGQADVAREVVMTNRELAGEYGRIGLDTGIRGDWARAVEIYLANFALTPVGGNAAFLLQHEGRPLDEVRAWAREMGAMDEQTLEHLFRVLQHPLYRTYPFTYTEGAALIRRWLEVTGQTAGFWRLLSEQLSPSQLLAELDGVGASASR